MHAQNSFVDQRRHGNIIKQFAKLSPELNVVAPSALVVETVDARYRLTLVIASEYEHFVGVTYFVSEQQRDRLYAIVAAINVVTHDYPFVIWWRAADLIHNTQHVEELTVEITCNN